VDRLHLRRLLHADPQLAGRSPWASPGLGPWEWFWILFYGFATYGNAGFLREQVCKYMCPYARFQSAMFDKDTLIISYDAERGEPRGSRPQGRPEGRAWAHCIDCGLCVQVCPTGIDIRKGLQYECIGCAACIDVCDGVMDKMGYPRGPDPLRHPERPGSTCPGAGMAPRVPPARAGLHAVLVLIVAAVMGSLALRTPFKVDVVRDRASLARIVDDGQLRERLPPADHEWPARTGSTSRSPRCPRAAAPSGSAASAPLSSSPADTVRSKETP
jgi:cytochrome c oxidase accessory protein FixG